MRVVIRLLLLAALLPVLYVASAAAYFPAVVWHRFRPPGETALMELRARQSESEGREWERRYEWVPLSGISPHFQRAVLAAEDTRFYVHYGFDFEQIREAWEDNRRRGESLRGASTITQQTVKNLYLSPTRNIFRKLREALLTGWMELWLPKNRILELYLNVVELGPGVFGAEAAARTYFDRSAARLTREQAALLAATLPAPLDRNPASQTAGLRRRQRMILGRMERFFEGGPRLAREAPVEELPAIPEAGVTDTLPAAPIDLPSASQEPAVPQGTPTPADSAPGKGAPIPSAPGDSIWNDEPTPAAGPGR